MKVYGLRLGEIWVKKGSTIVSNLEIQVFLFLAPLKTWTRELSGVLLYHHYVAVHIWYFSEDQIIYFLAIQHLNVGVKIIYTDISTSITNPTTLFRCEKT